MRTLLIAWLCLAFTPFTYAQIERFQKFEHTINPSSIPGPYQPLYSTKNPFDKREVILRATVYAPSGTTHNVEGFFYGNYTINTLNNSPHAMWPFMPGQSMSNQISNSWKVRFTPEEVGNYVIKLGFYFPNENLYVPIPNVSFSSLTESKPNSSFIRLNNGFDYSYDNGQVYHPIGLNVPGNPAWGQSSGPKVNFFETIFQRFDENGVNHARIWMNYAGTMAIQGIGYTYGCEPYLYRFNLADAYAFDQVFELAEQYNITLKISFFNANNFTQGDFWNKYNAYNANVAPPGPGVCQTPVGGPCNSEIDFFTNTEAFALQSNVVRYIIDRYGYSTQVIQWEIFNEIDQIWNEGHITSADIPHLVTWHNAMASIVRDHDVYNRALGTSYIGFEDEVGAHQLGMDPSMDLVSLHVYLNQWENRSPDQIFYSPANFSTKISLLRQKFPGKPVCLNEMGSLQMNGMPFSMNYTEYDPHGFSIHTDIWTSFFDADLGAGMNWTVEHFISRTSSFHGALNNLVQFRGLRSFVDQVPAKKGVKREVVHEENYFLRWLTTPENQIFGWYQDKAGTINNLIRSGSTGLNASSAPVMEPYVHTPNSANRPSFKANGYFSVSIPIPYANYEIKWYDTRTGNLIQTDRQVGGCNELNLSLPWLIKQTSRYMDAAFVIEPISMSEDWQKVWTNHATGNLGDSLKSKIPTSF
ncbi:DUF5060 domain-containing protein [bacterium SCSIO 12741]|nr:DUF5060 domain-containing protein [bacterium SCSIO 12741]